MVGFGGLRSDRSLAIANLNRPLKKSFSDWRPCVFQRNSRAAFAEIMFFDGPINQPAVADKQRCGTAETAAREAENGERDFGEFFRDNY